MKSIIYFLRFNRIFKSLDKIVEHHSNASEDLRNELNGNGVKPKFSPRKFKQAVKEAKGTLGA